MQFRVPAFLSCCAAVTTPGLASAHGGGHASGSADSVPNLVGILLVVIPLALVGAIFANGARRRWRPDAGRGSEQRRSLAFFAGLALIAAALLPPFETWAGQSASVHMVQHMMLMVAAPPLLVFSTVGPVLIGGLPRSAVRAGLGLSRGSAFSTTWRAIVSPPVALAALTAALWAWHAPALYQAALVNEPLHWLEHLSFVGAACLFWATLSRLSDPAGESATGPLYAFAALVQGSLLAALMIFAAEPWYPAYAPGLAAWGLSPIEDQRLAGLIMWVPGGIAILSASLILLYRWLLALERRHPSRGRSEGSRGPLVLALGAILLIPACNDEPDTSADATWEVPGGEPESGRMMIEFYQCGSCHDIPGVREADGVIGPPLTNWAKRAFIAGAVPNEPDNLIAWIINPHQIEPGTAMPALGVTEPEARDIAAYLYTLQ